ncbi:MAG: tetratricopeptide repeat protein [Deltaproteobacteria bacterium]|nr:tetratricopeptide repeat protein [Deltaproteobacteria bacterium]
MRLITACLAIVVIALSGTARGDRKTDRAARKSFQKGVEAFEEARLGDALDAFKRAYALRPSYRILYNIGQAEAELGHPARAIDSFKAYLADGGARITPERRMTIEREIVRLRGKVGEVLVQGPRGAEVWIDGERKGYLPMAGPILLSAGRHRLVIRHGRSEPCEEDILVKGGTRAKESCLLLDHKKILEDIAAEDDAADPESLDDFSIDESENESVDFLGSVAPWLATGLAAVTLTSGILCAWRASDLNTDLAGACRDGVCPPGRRDDVDALPRYAGAADGLFVATALLGTTAVLLFIAPWKDREKEDSVSLTASSGRKRGSPK